MFFTIQRGTFVRSGIKSSAILSSARNDSFVLVLSAAEIVLFLNPHDSTKLHVANPLTKQTVTLPTLIKSHPHILFACAYAKMEYKVLCIFRPDGGKHNCMMVTLGIDHAWRPINRPKFSDQGPKFSDQG